MKVQSQEFGETTIEEVVSSHPKNKPLTPGGAEVLDPTPMAPPIGYIKQPSLADTIRDMVRSERLKAEAEAAGYGSFEDEDDFDVGDDFDPTSPYEDDFEGATSASELRRRQEEALTSQPAPTAPPSPSTQALAAGDQPAAPVPAPAQPGGSGAAS